MWLVSFLIPFSALLVLKDFTVNKGASTSVEEPVVSSPEEHDNSEVVSTTPYKCDLFNHGLFDLSVVIIQPNVTLPKYGHGELNICCPHITDILRYT